METIDKDEQLSLENEIGWVSLIEFRAEQWWLKQDNVEIPLYGGEMLGNDF